MKTEESPIAPIPVATLSQIEGKRVSRRDLLGWAAQGALGLAAFSLLGRTAHAAGLAAPAYGTQGTKSPLERMLPGAREVGAMALGASKVVPNYSASLPFWGDGMKMDQPEYYETLQVGDVDGDGLDELIVRGPSGVMVQHFDPETGQWLQLATVGPPLSDVKNAQNGLTPWNQPQYYTTIQCANAGGFGVQEIIGRAVDGLRGYRYDGNSSSSTYRKFYEIPGDPGPFGDTVDGGIWTQEAHYATIKWGKNPKGNGLDFVIGRGKTGIVTYYYAEEVPGWITPNFNPGPWPDTGADGTNWTLPQYYETIQFGDVNHDGQDELIGRTASGIDVYKFDSSANNWELLISAEDSALQNFSDANGWAASPSYYRTIRCADIDGDGYDEILARSRAGIVAYHYATYASGQPSFIQMTAANGPCAWDTWSAEQYYSTICYGDIDGDGADELIVRDGNGIQTWKYFPSDEQWQGTWDQMDGNNPMPQPAWSDTGNDANGNPLADANGTNWDEVQYYSTIQFARTRALTNSASRFPNPNTAPTYDSDGNPRWAPPYATLIGRDKYGIQTWRYHQNTTTREDGGYWTRTSAPLPDFTSSKADAQLAAAYKALDNVLRGVSGDGNIRGLFNDDTSVLATYKNQMYTMPAGTNYYGPYIRTLIPTPTGIDDTAWQKVTWQIYWEMTYVILVNDWFGPNKMGALLTDTSFSQSDILTTVAQYASIGSNSSFPVVMSYLALLGNAAWAILGFPELDAGDLSALAGILGTCFSAVSQVEGGSWQGTYGELSEKLDNVFTGTLQYNAATSLYITGGASGLPGGTYFPGDFGMLLAIGQQLADPVTNGEWTWPTDIIPNITATINSTYAVECWKAIMGGSSWIIASNSELGPPDASNVYIYYPIPNSPYTWKSAEWLNTSYQYENEPPAYQYKLFDPRSSDPTQAFPLGIPLADVFNAENGWPQLPQKNFAHIGDATTPPPPAPTADLQTSVALTRNADTGEIEAALTFHNRGKGPATNVDLTSVTLGSRYPIAPLPEHRTRIAAGQKWTIYVSFSSDSGMVGQTAVLRVQGQYKEGTFGGSFRVQLP